MDDQKELFKKLKQYNKLASGNLSAKDVKKLLKELNKQRYSQQKEELRKELKRVNNIRSRYAKKTGIKLPSVRELLGYDSNSKWDINNLPKSELDRALSMLDDIRNISDYLDIAPDPEIIDIEVPESESEYDAPPLDAEAILRNFEDGFSHTANRSTYLMDKWYSGVLRDYSKEEVAQALENAGNKGYSYENLMYGSDDESLIQTDTFIQQFMKELKVLDGNEDSIRFISAKTAYGIVRSNYDSVLMEDYNY